MAKGMGWVHRLVSAQALSCPGTTHPSARGLMRIEELALGTVSNHVVVLAAKLGIAVVDWDTEVKEHLAQAKAATVLVISAMCDGAAQF